MRSVKSLNLTGSVDGLSNCPFYSHCDNPAVRDASDISKWKTINIRFNVLMNKNGKWPYPLTEYKLKAGIETFIEDYRKLNINFKVTAIEYIRDSKYYCLPAFSETDDRWYQTAEKMKQKYAVNYKNEVNVFIACMNTMQGQGGLLGYGTFPWDPSVFTTSGGVFLNSAAVGPGQRTLTHEFGHNLGLWHTFRGQSEVACGDSCYESVHQAGEKYFDYVGDFCSDTLAAPRYWTCSAPNVYSCYQQPWITSPSIYQNFMSYTPDYCMNTFSEQQIRRAHCYICNELRSIAEGCP